MKFDAEKFGAGVRDFITRAFVPVNARFAKLEARLDAVEKSAAEFRYRGVWQYNETYTAGNFATFDGNLWACKVAATKQQPGTGGDWQLCCRKGRDGRDGRSAA